MRYMFTTIQNSAMKKIYYDCLNKCSYLYYFYFLNYYLDYTMEIMQKCNHFCQMTEDKYEISCTYGKGENQT